MTLVDVQARPKKRQTRAAPGQFCVFVSSSDRARDVFEIVFQNADTIWRDCDWPRYVAFTSQHPDIYGFTALAAKRPSDWRGELGDQLDSLPDHVEYVMLLVEDTLFMSPIDGTRLNEIADLMVRDDLAYVRLVPVTRNLPGRVVEYLRRKMDRRPLRPIAISEPYYSSVEFALWRRDYLRTLLRQPGSIWEFEHTLSNEAHHAVWEPLVDQHQIVTRGRWNLKAPRLLSKQGLTLAGSKREFQSLRSWLKGARERFMFQTVGFLSFRIRRRLNRTPRS